MTDKKKDLTKHLKELVPIDLLTEEQRMKMMDMNKIEAIMYFNSLTNKGSKIGAAYYDLYADVFPDSLIPKLGASIVEYENGWYTIDITYNGQVIKTIRK